MPRLIVIGVILFVLGILIIRFRARFARANAAQNSVLLSGRLSGPGFQRYSRGLNVVTGVGFIIFGVIFVVVGIAHHTHH